MPRTKMGRPPQTDRPIQWTIRLPQSIAAPWELLFHDPVKGRTKVGPRRFIIGELMKLTYEAFREGKTTIDISHIINFIRRETQ